ncbi:MAG: HAD family phosphatase [Candidatus Diapherotrites archaeon]|nr:HAD family phosphatase [Candidatus Diapherotrites archaeon]
MIEVILTDFGGVVFSDIFPGFSERYKAKKGLNEEKVFSSFKGEHWRRYETGKIGEEEFLGVVAKNLGTNESIEELRKEVLATIVPLHENIEFYRKVSKKYKLAGFSNNSIEFMAHSVGQADVSFFSKIFNSAEIGLRKPDMKFYEFALKELGVAPQKIVFIDDKEVNLVPAKKLGMNVIHYKDHNQLKKDLEKLNVKVFS